MIELKISTSAAVLILTERMEFELQMRKNAGILPQHLELRDLKYNQLLDVAEFATTDIIAMIPLDILSAENNLPLIVSKAMTELANTFNFTEFKSYSLERARTLVINLKTVFLRYKGKQNFIYN